MIVSFADKETEKIFEGLVSRKLPVEMQRTARKKLIMLHGAIQILDLKIPPGNRLEKLKGKQSDLHSIRINDQWRIIFTWSSGNAEKVQIVDYHK